MDAATAEKPKAQLFTGGTTTAWAQERLEKLLAEDEQFKAARARPEVTARKQAPGLRLAEVVQIVMEGYSDRPAIGERARELVTDPLSGRTTQRLLGHFETRSFGELWARVQATAAEWHADAQDPLRPGAFLAVLGFASADYAAMALTGVHLGAVNVPLQATAPARQLADIVGETEPTVLAASINYLDLAVETALLGFAPPRIVVFDYEPRDDDQRERFERARAALAQGGAGSRLEALDEVIARGRALPPAPLHVSDEEDPLTWLFYTSGTTGTPKGAMITEATTRNTWLYSAEKPSITLSFMPMSHMVGYGYLFLALANGGCSYCSPKSDLSTLFEDLAMVRPTMSSLVPRVCEMLYQHYLGEVDRRVGAGEDEAAAQEAVKLDIRENLLGGRLLSVGCGSALLSPEVHEFMLAMLGIHMAIGYSSTEMATATVLVDGKIQRPPVIDYRLADVPELGYFTTDKPYPRGEFLVKIPKFMAGYYKRPELTAEKFTEDGFYRSGDVMALVGPDELVYLDRTNNVQKLSQGEFVAIARLEALYGQHPAIRQIFVYGSSDRAFLLAVAVPSAELAARLPGAADEVKAIIRKGIKEVAEEFGLASYEVPRDIALETEPFSPENGLLTGIGKFSRPNFKARYGERLEQIYAQMAQDQVSELRALRLGGADRPMIDTVLRAVQATLGVAASEVTPASRFSDLGGDSLSALSLSMLLEEIFGREVPVGVIINPAGNLQLVADYVEALSSGEGRASFATVHEADSDTVHAADLKLAKFIPADILAAAPGLPAPASEIGTVLLTGSTGFLGRFQAMAWLEHFARRGSGKVILLARGADAADARRRIEDGMASDPALPARFTELARAHLEVVPGDLGLPSLGIDATTWDRLAGEVDLIAHTAAHVNHVLPYTQLFTANVGGTAELIRLALTGRAKHFDYVSTLGVIALAGALVPEDADIREVVPSARLGDDYANGYNISKWAGEVLLREAHHLCALPVGVFRPGMILAHSRHAGQLNVPDMFSRLLYSLAATGVAPATFYAEDLSQGRPAGKYEGIAVDYLAEAITAIGLKGQPGYHSYNLASADPASVSLDDFVDWMIADGIEIERVPTYSQWLSHFETAMNALPEDKRRQSLLTIMEPWRQPQATLGGTLPAERFNTAAAEANRPVPQPTEQLIRKYLADFRHLDLL